MLLYRTVIEEIDTLNNVITKRYEQTTDAIDLPKIIDAINTPPNPKRVRRKRGATIVDALKSA